MDASPNFVSIALNAAPGDAAPRAMMPAVNRVRLLPHMTMRTQQKHASDEGTMQRSASAGSSSQCGSTCEASSDDAAGTTQRGDECKGNAGAASTCEARGGDAGLVERHGPRVHLLDVLLRHGRRLRLRLLCLHYVTMSAEGSKSMSVYFLVCARLSL